MPWRRALPRHGLFGLLMAGGPRSFGAGNWAGSGVEKMLPVEFERRIDLSGIKYKISYEAQEIVDEYFVGTTSQLGGVGLDVIAEGESGEERQRELRGEAGSHFSPDRPFSRKGRKID